MTAWLHAVPDGSKEPRQNSESWPMPSVDNFNYIAGWFFSLRMSFDYNDMLAWSQMTGYKPNPEEVDLLMLMSITYSNSIIKYRSKEFNLLPPHDGRSKTDIDNMISEKMMRSLKRFS